MKWSFWKKRKERTKIIERSNVIQYDDMGYPLRLCIMSDNTQAWIDTNERDGDIVLRWEERKSELCKSWRNDDRKERIRLHIIHWPYHC